MTVRVYDTRMFGKAIHLLGGVMGAIRSIRFSPDGAYFAMAEAADFVHIHDVNQGFRRAQVIDTFGEIAGISFTPDSEQFFIANADDAYG